MFENGKADLFRTIMISVETVAMGFCSGKKRMRSTLNIRKVKIYNLRAEQGSSDGKLLRGNIRGKGRVS